MVSDAVRLVEMPGSVPVVLLMLLATLDTEDELHPATTAAHTPTSAAATLIDQRGERREVAGPT